MNANGVSTGEAHLCIAANEEVDVNRIGRLRIDVAPQGSHKAHDVRGAAGNVNPLEAFVAAEGAQRILIEEAISLERNAIREAVIKNPLQYIDVLGVLMQLEHALIPHDVSVGGTSLVPSAEIGKLISAAELLMKTNGPDAPGQIKLVMDNVFPDLVRSFLILRPSRQRR